MDPRHPEQAVSRVRELMKQYNKIEKSMGKATTSAELAQLEREGGLVVQEICLVAPRIHEALMQTARQRRQAISRGLTAEKVPETTGVENDNDSKTAEPTEEPEEGTAVEKATEVEETEKEESPAEETPAEETEEPTEEAPEEKLAEKKGKKPTEEKKGTGEKNTKKKAKK